MEKLLIVEDDKAIRALLKKVLKLKHYVETTELVEDAKNRVESVPFDLVLVDQNLPDGTGLELAAYLDAEQVSFMFVSADDSPELMRQAMELGALGFITKPFDLEKAQITIDGAINQALEKRKTNRDLVVNVAVGLMMERGNLARKDAYLKLRDKSRERNLTIIEAAEELIVQVETVNYYLS